MSTKKTTYKPPKSDTSTIGIRGHKPSQPHEVRVKPYTRQTKYGMVQVNGYSKTVG